jgi:hypothetical protein
MSKEERGRMFWTGSPMEARDVVIMAMIEWSLIMQTL